MKFPYVTILAAGKSKRMRTQKSKVLHNVAGKPILFYSLRMARSLQPAKIFIVVGENSVEVINEFKSKDIQFVKQKEPLGTGYAVMQLAPFLSSRAAEILVMPGDAPLLKVETVEQFWQFHQAKKAIVSILTADFSDPTGYGRIVRDTSGRVLRIVEEVDATSREKKIKEVNSSIYLFRIPYLFKALEKIKPENRQEEFYLTDVIHILSRDTGGVFAYKIENFEEMMGVNTRNELAKVEVAMQKRLREHWMARGTTLVMPETVYLEEEVELNQDIIIYPFVSLLGKTTLGKGAVVGPHTTLVNVEVAPGVKIKGGVFLENERIKQDI